ncbi:hypothetical protein fugu_008377 [Takifugu bimaculatus]|uniref:SAM-dependent MTase RsmB/NOP-type domain-containing protein n=1 Tax=Takifugu bimaculatus TaxID=433685 RepID=A0A4Z2B3C1_9TELE|nr:hypothetical protein fugu_008377 [Takifugu bimaculatus]
MAEKAITPPSDQVYIQAAAVFHQLRPEKPTNHQHLHYGKKPDEIKDEIPERRAFQLAFKTLKYEALLEDIITDSCFHTTQHIASNMLPLAMVMLFDFQERKFMPRKCSAKEDEPLQEVRNIESSLQRYKTKLAASLARCRIKQRLQSVSCFLSEPVRTRQHRAKHLPHYVWVNTLKNSVEEVCEAFRKASFHEVKHISNLGGSTFCRDPLCPDTLVFSQQLYALVQFSSLMGSSVLHMQDRSVCVVVSVLRPLLFEKSDVLAAGTFSGLTAAQVAVAAATRCSRVLLCGSDHTPSHIKEMTELFTQMNIKSKSSMHHCFYSLVTASVSNTKLDVKILPETFCGLHDCARSIHRLKVILVLPRCSCSALSDPVPLIHGEHGDVDLLSDLSQGSVSQSRIQTMTTQQARLLAHALSFQKVQTVVYCTRSVYPEENQQLVKRVLDKIHTHPKVLPFRVNGPIFPDHSPSGDTMDSEFFRLEPSQLSNGCFIARLSRQADPTKVESVHDVLARAVAKGLLGGIISRESKKGKREKRRKDRKDPADSKPSSPSSHDEETGNEFEDDHEPLYATEHDEGEDEHEKRTGGKKKGTKGRKQQVKRRAKQSVTISRKQQSDSKKPAKKKQQPQHRRHHRKRRARKIPRLTLSLMSSTKPSSSLSTITALAHKLSKNVAIESQQILFSPRTPDSGPHLSSRPAVSLPAVLQRQNTDAGRAEKKVKNIKAGTSKTRAKVVKDETEVVTQVGSEAAGLVLPPISKPHHSFGSRSGSSGSHLHSQASRSKMSSSSSTSLLGL